MNQGFQYPLGNKIAKIMKIRGIGIEMLAKELGISVSEVVNLGKNDTIDAHTLQQIANALGVTVEEINNFNDEGITINIQNMNDSAGVYQYNFNPIDKIVELYEELLRLEREKSAKLEADKNNQS